MKTEKKQYERPETLVIEVRTEGLICASRNMSFGSPNRSGDFDDDDVVNGGDF